MQIHLYDNKGKQISVTKPLKKHGHHTLNKLS
jgi:hypothetical protein